MADDQLLKQIQALPKIELHRHLEGSVRLETLIDIAQEFGIEMPEYDTETLRPFVQMMPDETRNWQHFLGKFQTLRQFFRSPSVIKRVTREAVADAAADNVRYLEIRFTPPALSNLLHCSYHDVVSWVCEAAEAAAREHDITVRLILSMNRHESVKNGEKVLQAAIDFREQGVVALDLAGREEGFSSEPFRRLFERAKAHDLGVTIHAGEWGGADNIREAVEHFNADRIGHGVRVLGKSSITEMLIRRGVVLEVCPTSNIHSGVVSDWSVHPLPRLFNEGVMTTINTDDPLVSNITLSEELYNAVQYMGLTLENIKHQTMIAAKSAFLPAEERESLVKQYEAWFSSSH